MNTTLKMYPFILCLFRYNKLLTKNHYYLAMDTFFALKRYNNNFLTNNQLKSKTNDDYRNKKPSQQQKKTYQYHRIRMVQSKNCIQILIKCIA